MNIIIAGSTDISTYILSRLLKEYRKNIKLIITQPDKKAGRGQKIGINSLKKIGIENNIEIIQPEKINSEESINYLKNFTPAIFIIIAYGQILSDEIINIFNNNCINIHFSLLPDLRGPTPVETAILKGYKKTGITIQRINKEVDAGDIILQKEIEIDENITAGELFEKMKEPAAQLLFEFLEKFEKGEINYYKQNNNLATYTKKIKKEDGKINWNDLRINIHNKIRAYNPKPLAYTFYKKKYLKIYKSNLQFENMIYNNNDLKNGIIILKINNYL